MAESVVFKFFWHLFPLPILLPTYWGRPIVPNSLSLEFVLLAELSHTRLRGRHMAQTWANQDVPSSVHENGCPDGQMTQVNSIIINSSLYA